jgi:predicted nucleic acid-binding protein
MILIDTDVMVDIIRRHAPAVAWLDLLEGGMIGIPGLVAMELL